MARPIRLLERLRRSKANWTVDDLDRLYNGFGFDCKHGRRHDLYVHPVYPDLRAAITRGSRHPLVAYVADAVKIIDALLAREGS